jgi:hypothetical protein
MAKPKIKSDERTITVRIPIAIRIRGGKKLVLAPDGKNVPTFSRRTDDSMVKAIARACRWQELLENGTYATVAEIAAAEKINESYVGRIFRLTLLAPRVIEAIFDGSQSAGITLATLMRPFPVEWQSQYDRANFGRLF